MQGLSWHFAQDGCVGSYHRDKRQSEREIHGYIPRELTLGGGGFATAASFAFCVTYCAGAGLGSYTFLCFWGCVDDA